MPEQLIFDPNLAPLKYEGINIGGVLINTGQDITMEIIDEPSHPQFTFTSGPLSYSYKASKIKLHFGTDDKKGSEHLIAGKQFPLELQVIGYNIDLYRNFTEALLSTHGIAVISILGAIDEPINYEFDKVLAAAKHIRYRGMQQNIHDFSILDLIPPSELYITYEGSITQPSCQETVTWVIINKPLYITKDQMSALRVLNNWNEHNPDQTPLVENNFRPPNPLNRRPVRTNISPYKENEDCAAKLIKSYKVNKRLIGL